MFIKFVSPYGIKEHPVMEFASVFEACEYVLNNAFKFTNWSLLKSDIIQVCYKTSSGDWFLDSIVDLQKNEVIPQTYGDLARPEPYVKNSEQKEPVENSNQNIDVENHTCESCKYRNIYYRCDCHSSHNFDRELRFDDSCIFYVNKHKYNAIFRESG